VYRATNYNSRSARAVGVVALMLMLKELLTQHIQLPLLLLNLGLHLGLDMVFTGNMHGVVN